MNGSSVDHRFQRGGNNHLESEFRKDIHRKRGEFVVCFVKRLIEDHRRVSGNSVIVAAQLISQGRCKAGRGELLPLPTRLASAPAINLHLFTLGIHFPPNEFHMLPDVEDQSAPALLVRLLAAQPLHQPSQTQEAHFSLVAIVGPGMAECLLTLLFELPHVIEVPVAGVDMEVRAAAEFGLAEAFVDEIQTIEMVLRAWLMWVERAARFWWLWLRSKSKKRCS